MKILSASIRVIDGKNNIRTLGLEDVEITIKADNPIKDIPQIVEEVIPEKKEKKTKKTKKPKK